MFEIGDRVIIKKSYKDKVAWYSSCIFTIDHIKNKVLYLKENIKTDNGYDYGNEIDSIFVELSLCEKRRKKIKKIELC